MASKPGNRRRAKTKTATPRTKSRNVRRKAAELDLRRTPLQARGQATFERILDSTARLLDDVGLDAITTNLIAKAAGVNVATLYQYFPNKQAVLLALFQRQSSHRNTLAESMVAGFGARSDWRRTLDDLVTAVADLRRSEPGAVALRQAMRASPDLLEHDVRGTRLASQRLAEALTHGAGVADAEASLVARCSIESMTALLDMWSIESSGRDARILDQTKKMLGAYLAPYLDDRTRKGVVPRKSQAVMG